MAIEVESIKNYSVQDYTKYAQRRLISIFLFILHRRQNRGGQGAMAPPKLWLGGKIYCELGKLKLEKNGFFSALVAPQLKSQS